jgi:VanZ family protein
MSNIKTKIIISVVTLVFWMALILWFSSDNSEVSSSKSESIVQRIEPVVVKLAGALRQEPITRVQLHVFVRKNAHMFNYFILSLLAYRVFSMRGGLAVNKRLFWAWFLATAFAAADEFYQTFIPGRTGKVSDIVIDNIGVLLGLLLISLITMGKRAKKYQQNEAR